MATFILIQSITVSGTSQASLDFTSIPATYTDLCIVFSGRDYSYTAANSSVYLAFNNTTANTVSQYLYSGNGSSAGTGSANSAISFVGQQPGANIANNVFGSAVVYVNNYTLSQHKVIGNTAGANSTTNGTGVWGITQSGTRWSDNSVINRLTLTCDGSFKQHSSAYLYGIKSS